MTKYPVPTIKIFFHLVALQYSQYNTAIMHHDIIILLSYYTLIGIPMQFVRVIKEEILRHGPGDVAITTVVVYYY